MDTQRYAEGLIEAALARGELVPLEGRGEPLRELDRDPAWWVKAFLHREQLPERRTELSAIVDAGLASAVAAATLDEARAKLAAVNRTVRAWNAEAPIALRIEERSEIWLLAARAGHPD
jgi:hypothetical protein